MAANGKQRVSSNKKKKKSVSTSPVSKKKSKKVPKQKEADFAKFHSEIVILLAIAWMLFLLFSNFSLCGSFGDAISNVFFGIFGWIQYLLPILGFFSLAFLISNDFSTLAVKKVFLCILTVCDIAAFLQLLLSIPMKKAIVAYHYAKYKHIGGGYVGTGISNFLSNNLGTFGAYLVLIACFVIFTVLITERSFLALVKQSSGTVARNIKEHQNRAKQTLQDTKKQREMVKRTKQEKKQASNIQLTPEVSKEPISVPKEKDIQELQVQDRGIEPILEEKELETFHSIPTKQEEVAITMPKETSELSEDQIYTVHSSEDYSETSSYDSWNTDSLPTEEEYLQYGIEQEEEIYQEHTSFSKEYPVEPLMELTESDVEKEKIETKSMQVIKKLARQSIDEPKLQKEQQVPIQENIIPKKQMYEFPPIQLLNQGAKQKNSDAKTELRETAIKLQKTLENFGVGVTITDVSQGPAVTRYELQPEQGVKVSKIVSLTDDIKLNLAAADIRMEAPIPGKAAIGIEVPNKTNTMVAFRDLIENEEFRKYPSDIAFAVGKDIGGKTIVTDIGKMPHLLIAGATGSGKSVCINTLIMSILYKAKPEDVKLIMIDPKVVELSTYNGIPHLLIPVVTDPKKASSALNWAVTEMTQRYKKFAEVNVRNLKGYNTKVEEVLAMEGSRENSDLQKLPQIVIIVDELADLMMVAPGEVEDAIVRLSQLARAAGIHLVIATQRPSVNVITGLIKANVPSRIAFSVSSGVDSRTILDMNGAEKLLGKGDMLFYPSGYQKPVRVQGAFISDNEVTKVVDFLKGQQLEVSNPIQEEIEEKINVGMMQDTSITSEYDEYFEEAGKFVIEKEKASIGMLQRMFKIGFNRAARIMEQLQEVGVVGTEEGTKPRKVLMSLSEFEEYLKN